MNKPMLRGDQKGFAALLVAMVIVTVVALLTVGFAQLMRNEVSQSLNKQLSNQAYYAAESGINDAIKALSLDPTINKSTCPPLPVAGTAAEAYLTDNMIDGENSQWTCLLIDSSPGSLVFGNVDRINPTTFNVSSVDAGGSVTPFNEITIYWQDASPSNPKKFRPNSGTANNKVFPQLGAAGASSSANEWGDSTGVLRVTITDITDGNYTRQGLIDDTMIVFLYPSDTGSSGPNTTNFNTTQNEKGNIVDGKCADGNLPRACSVKITGLTAASKLMFTLRSVYKDTSVYITGDPSTELTGAQSLVDVTGRSQDILKRVQVRIPSKGRYYLPGFNVEAVNGVCKQLELLPSSGTDNCTY